MLVALRGARNQAKDARIIAEMSQLRSIAEMAYSDGSYSAFTDTDVDGDYTYEGVQEIVDDVLEQNENAAYTAWSNGDYCAYVTLNTGDYYCIDSAGNAIEISESSTPACADGTYTCE